jgi:hypothetical protein
LKNSRVVVLIFVLIALLLACSPAFAEPTTLWKLPQIITFDAAGFQLEAPANISDRAVFTTVESLDYKKIVPSENYFVVSAVDISMLSAERLDMKSLTKQVRQVFSFTYIDFKRASRLNTNLSTGHFRIGYWDAAENNWIDMPSRVFWDGTNGAVETETNRGSGKYALLWSYRDNAQLSPSAGENIRIMLNLNTIYPDVPPYIKDGRTMVPLRVIAENMDARVDWAAPEQRIDLVRNVDKVQLWIGETGAFLNNNHLTLEVAPEITNGLTFVPLRFVAEALGAQVTWDSVTRTAKILKY